MLMGRSGRASVRDGSEEKRNEQKGTQSRTRERSASQDYKYDSTLSINVTNFFCHQKPAKLKTIEDIMLFYVLLITMWGYVIMVLVLALLRHPKRTLL